MRQICDRIKRTGNEIYIYVIIGVLLLLTSCVRDNELEETNDGINVQFVGCIDYEDEPNTRVDFGSPTQWATGDQLGVYVHKVGSDDYMKENVKLQITNSATGEMGFVDPGDEITL